jgi:hypothetical protein
MSGEFEKIEVKLSALGVTKKLFNDSEDLDSIEQQYGFRLPSEYRKFLLEYGRIDFPTGISYLLKERVPEVARLGDFYDLQSDGFNNLRKNIDTYRGRMAFNIIPIADCPGGDLICIGVIKEVYGRIFFWDHNQEKFDPSENELWSNVYLVSDSFLGFILSLQKIEESTTPRDLGIVKVTTTPEFLALVEKFKNKS